MKFFFPVQVKSKRQNTIEVNLSINSNENSPQKEKNTIAAKTSGVKRVRGTIHELKM